MFYKSALFDLQMLFQDNCAENETFRIFYAIFYVLLSVAAVLIVITKSFLGYIILINNGNFTEVQVWDFYLVKFNNELKRIALSNFDYIRRE